VNDFYRAMQAVFAAANRPSVCPQNTFRTNTHGMMFISKTKTLSWPVRPTICDDSSAVVLWLRRRRRFTSNVKRCLQHSHWKQF